MPAPSGSGGGGGNQGGGPPGGANTVFPPILKDELPSEKILKYMDGLNKKAMKMKETQPALLKLEFFKALLVAHIRLSGLGNQDEV